MQSFVLRIYALRRLQSKKINQREGGFGISEAALFMKCVASVLAFVYNRNNLRNPKSIFSKENANASNESELFR